MENTNIEKKAKIVSFINMKGGVAKTTLCKELGVNIAGLNPESEPKKILFIDLDPQSNLTQSLFEVYDVIKEDDQESLEGVTKRLKELPSINNLFNNKAITEPPSKDSLILNLSDNIDIIPGSLNSVFYGTANNGDNEQALHNFIKHQKLRKSYDFIFIDCPPTYSLYTISAILASDYYSIPVKPEAYSALGIDLLEEVIAKIKQSYSDTFEIKPLSNIGIIFTKYEKTSSGETKIKNQITTSKHLENIYKFNNYFPFRNKLATVKLGYLISNSTDTNLIDYLTGITKEFIERIDELDEIRNE
ncbi:hypothetical protein LCW_03370 [Latilactobacillus curvatus]|uniref:ParA family protein n=1 Tax=Latilactobacillus curvatus TaxID=28038 RepID=UPI00084A1645|nr:AAA family ATPase [Latilactobacillus curvatus]AOO75165.1 hypothetical protein LCW_03370 [Latilactobacillus curvatus]